MPNKLNIALASAVAAATLIFTSVASATPAISFTSTTFSTASSTSTRGWEFDVTNGGGIVVTHLGLWDEGADGLAQSHAIGIWDSAMTLLTSATIASGIAAPLDVNNLFRLVDIPDIVLPQATGYRIGAVYLQASPDRQATGSGILSVVDPRIAYVEGRFVGNGLPALTFPTATCCSPGLLGPSFEIQASSAIPEPGTLAILGLGLAGLGLARRKRAA